jgi:hypothetical protein
MKIKNNLTLLLKITWGFLRAITWEFLKDINSKMSKKSFNISLSKVFWMFLL